MIYTQHGRTANGAALIVISESLAAVYGLCTTIKETYLNPRISRLCQFYFQPSTLPGILNRLGRTLPLPDLYSSIHLTVIVSYS